MNDASLLLGVMDATEAVAIAGWVWAVLGAIALIASLVITVLIYRGKPTAESWTIKSGWDIPKAFGVTIAIGVAGSGLLTMGLSAAGLPVAGMWIWHASSVLVLLLGIMLAVKVFWSMRKWSADNAPGGKLIASGSALGTLIVAGLLASLAFQAKTVTIGAALAAAAPVNSAESTASIWSTRIFWQNVTLGTLAFGTIIFVLLFVERIQRGGAPQIETHWGGIGGGLGGWRISASLSYLISASVLGILFSVYLIHAEKSERRQETATSSQATHAEADTKNGAVSIAKPGNAAESKSESGKQR